jgi:hypothetical protein
MRRDERMVDMRGKRKQNSTICHNMTVRGGRREWSVGQERERKTL